MVAEKDPYIADAAQTMYRACAPSDGISSSQMGRRYYPEFSASHRFPPDIRAYYYAFHP